MMKKFYTVFNEKTARWRCFGCFLILFIVAVPCFAYEDGIRIAWDYNLRLRANNGSYARVKCLSNNKLALVYGAGSDVYFRLQNDRNTGWGSIVTVSHDDANNYNYTNSELIELQNGTLVYAWNARPKILDNDTYPYKIMIKKSVNRGATWTDEQSLYAAGTVFGDGCWEPAFLQLPTGELQIYFANENPYRQSSEQEISLLRSFDNGATWSGAETISFRAETRDGMPVPVYLQDDKGIAMAIEDNGINGTFKPVIVHTTVADNWSSGLVAGNSTRRWHALRSDYQLPTGVVGGAPYLIQLHSGETLLSFQSGEGRNTPDTHTYANMQVYIGSNEAKDFSRKSSPFPLLPAEAQALWSSLCQISDTTVMAVSSLGGMGSGNNGIWTATGHIVRPLDVNHTSSGKWSTNNSVFIGALSPASMKMKASWDADSLYFRFDVKDAVQTALPEGGNVWDSDGIEIFLDPKHRNSMTSDIYKFAVNINGETHFRRRENNDWVENQAATNIQIERNSSGYSIVFNIPMSAIGGVFSRNNTFGIHFKLHNNDNGTITHDDLSAADADIPKTWLKATLLQPTGVKKPKGNAESINVWGTRGGLKIDGAATSTDAKVGIFSMLGRKLYNGPLNGNDDFFALSPGVYIVKIDDVYSEKTGKVVVF
ncbi:MAG: T9SS type A sorting domain-containing protein [Prevotella sp.]|nr:T9SS type A sorting domain-containing protein [Prevotella sp.]